MRIPRAFRALLGGIGLAALCGCGAEEAASGSQAFALRFSAKVGDRPFSCTETFDGIGTSGASVKPLDFRMYLHDVRLLRQDGSEQPLSLEQDGRWQRDAVALLDFEDGTGTCKTGSPDTRTQLVGTAPAGDYVGVRFALGVPAALNHLDAATAPAPFNIPGLWWSWKGGYKFVRLDLATAEKPAYFFHLGATSCEGSVNDGFSCASSNIADIRLEGADPEASTIVFDVAALHAESDLDRPIDEETDGVSGCMAFAGDPECPAVFKALGMSVEGERGDVEQTVFRVE